MSNLNTKQLIQTSKKELYYFSNLENVYDYWSKNYIESLKNLDKTKIKSQDIIDNVEGLYRLKSTIDNFEKDITSKKNSGGNSIINNLMPYGNQKKI